MWRRVTVEASIDQPIDRVFEHLADPTTWHEFVPAVKLRRAIGSGPVEVGSRWEAIDGLGPVNIRFTDELLEMEPGRRVVFGSSSPWNARTEYRLGPTASGTRVSAVYEGDVEGWLRLLSWLPGSIIAATLARDFKRLEALLRAKAPSGER